ncbi:hypothetical protein AYM02_08170 [Coxiella burnetii]|uniref:Uncharacterized protein n=2 Tax=Coxiella burnetii TaxID=777 RepID=Q83CV8_COXBU|nr:hypothetical protein [Coxiella burnetii]NP_820001.1 hypothetical protein CBU_0994 [Coxiella burnetii RSA 493]ACI23140.1 hypothetical protein CBUD_1052a [Coxiella burnetii Dugway 5J108-111]ACJ18365.1 hypothetical protein CbuG_1013 [Coxiella burnetii CbuG_Q212]ATN85723.1 hypothetical protein AYO29_04190 [Coxiella burnetii str. Schperling]AAO90515.1 hypothetical protein CBU_0994 [Coxiella burnetii RSA 493]AML49281.1 hypothetical protein AUR58_08920 [Coxiella burnetii]
MKKRKTRRPAQAKTQRTRAQRTEGAPDSPCVDDEA